MHEYRALIFVLTGLLILAFGRRQLIDAILEALNNFRGGPPTTMHPSPVNDATLLRKRLLNRAARK